ncbi:MAG: thermonuclease family protein [Alphaproteobacteria bacterium]|nr:MAG: thermonuclease family protein [Alphaproteobacteria bacterium]
MPAIFALWFSDMPDFTVFDKTTLITIASAAATFIAVLGIGLAVIKDKTRIQKKRQKTRGGKGWQNARQSLRHMPWKRLRFSSVKNLRNILIILFLLSIILVGKVLEPSPPKKSGKNVDSSIFCHSPYIIDGDTFDCVGTRIRLMGIDAPEMPDHCRPGRRCTEGDPFAAKKYLESLATGWVKCRAIEIDHYGRTIARCKVKDVDLSCAMIASGHAVRRYSSISCP